MNSPANEKEGILKYHLNDALQYSFFFYSSYFPEPDGSEKHWYQHTYTSLKTCKGGNWCIKIIIFPSVNTVYNWVYLKVSFHFVCNSEKFPTQIHHWSLVSVYSYNLKCMEMYLIPSEVLQKLQRCTFVEHWMYSQEPDMPLWEAMRVTRTCMSKATLGRPRPSK